MSDNNDNERLDPINNIVSRETLNNPSWNKDWNDIEYWFGDKRHFRPWFDDDADYNTNAKSYYDYLGYRIKVLNEVVDRCNVLLRRDLKVENSKSITLQKTGNWQQQEKHDTKNDIETLTALINLSKKEANALQILDDGVYSKDFSEDIKDLHEEIKKLQEGINGLADDLQKMKIVTDTEQYLDIKKVNEVNPIIWKINFSSDFNEKIKPLLVYKSMSNLDFRYLPMQTPQGTITWETAYHNWDFQCVRQGRIVTLTAYVHVTAISPDVKEYHFLDLVQEWAKPKFQVSWAGSFSNKDVTNDVSVHGYLQTNGIMNVTTGPYDNEFNGGWLVFGMSYQANDI
ncbi:MAG: hypothetical protein J6574_03920 [Gilliamella sp.]|nr:hypothetical protein [Gilliamella sp.]